MILFDALLVAVCLNILVFFIAFKIQSDKLTDFTYGMTFIAIAFYAGLGNVDKPYVQLVLALVVLWGLRLSVYLVTRIRRINKDARFDGMRENFLKFGRFWILQGISAWVIMLPAIFALTKPVDTLTLTTYVGIFIWAVGFYFEAVGDYQKYRFINNPKNKGRWIDTGLWAYTRHPNYFGEILMWIGMYIIAYPVLSTLQAFIGLASPFWISILLLFLSGIPILEKSADKKWGNQNAYQKYKKQTPILVPFFHI